MNTSGILNRPRGVRTFSPTPGERVRDPLEDYNPSPELSGLEIPKKGGKEEESPEGEGEESVRTVVPISAADGEGNADGTAIDEEGSISERSVGERRERERERRWSVTNDEVVSD